VAPTENTTHELQIQREGKMNAIKQDAKSSPSIKIDTIFLQPRRPPSSFPHLSIGMKSRKLFMTHFYLSNAKIN
jgi:hypothetical protein